MTAKGERAAGRLHTLTARQVQAAKPGDYVDGGGLALRVSEDRASWVFRYTSPTGKRREMGLGALQRGDLAQAGRELTAARDAAHRARELLRVGVDPIDAREERKEAARAAQAAQKAKAEQGRWTLARCARNYHACVIEPTKSPKHAANWINSLENHVAPALWHAPIDSIEPPALLSALLDAKPHERARRLPNGTKIHETRQRIRQRLDAVFEDAIFHKRCSSNPAAAIRRKMREATGRIEHGKMRALPYREAPAFMAALRASDGIAARCLEFTVLTAARTGESLFAEWCEVDLDAGTWLVPKERMKGKEPHLVFLSPRALDVLKAVQGLDERFVFPSVMKRGSPMSNMAMLVVLNRLGARSRTTVHGLARATFSTWANETGVGRPDVIEACLAHEEGNRVRAAYNRAKFNEERRALLDAWADYLSREPAQVIELQSKRA